MMGKIVVKNRAVWFTERYKLGNTMTILTVMFVVVSTEMESVCVLRWDILGMGRRLMLQKDHPDLYTANMASVARDLISTLTPSKITLFYLCVVLMVAFVFNDTNCNSVHCSSCLSYS